MKRACLIFLSLLMLLPAAARASRQSLRVGSDISYAPLEFYASGSKRVEGFDYDLAQAIAVKMHASIVFQNHNFDDLLASLDAGKFDLVISAMNDTRERAGKADFVDYFLAGSGILVNVGNPHHVFNIASLCGMTVDLQRGTAQDGAIAAQSEKCASIGLHPITVLKFTTDGEALKQFLAGKSMAHISDYPVVSHLARTFGGGKKYIVAGEQFGVVPYGIAVSKSDPVLRDRVQRALKAVIADGTYDALLRKWGLEQGAMRSAPVNAGTKFQ
ncbi:MAG TPA: ABC transporter substrate-binding protein [Candidatus Baltobacteraceae bacterium]